MSTSSPTSTTHSNNTINVKVDCKNNDPHRTDMQKIEQVAIHNSNPTPSIISSATPRVVHFAESLDHESEEKNDYSVYHTTSVSERPLSAKQENESNPTQSSSYSSMYLSPQELPFQLLSRSSPNSPIGSNVSIVGSLMSHGSNGRKSNIGGNGGGSTNWRLRTKYYSKRRGQERSIDRERQPSICSDSETDSINGQQKIEDILKSCGNTKKWSLPLPMVIRSSESDSASSSWSARSADEATEDERSPVPSPSASTHSNEEYLTTISGNESNNIKSQALSPTTSDKMSELSKKSEIIIVSQPDKNMETNKKHTSSLSSMPATTSMDASSNIMVHEDSESSKSKKDKGKSRRKKKMSRAAESHSFQRMKTTNYGRCIICDAYVYFWGFECTQCQLICHKKCLKKMAIMCPQAPLPPRSSILNMELDSLSSDEMVPLLVQKCTMEIERRAITRPGIYRMTGVASRVEKLLKSFESGPHLIDLTDVSANDLTSVLKVFLRELKIPLISNIVYKDFIDLGRIYRLDSDISQDGLTIGGTSQLIQKIHIALNQLTPHHRATLKHMIQHLTHVVEHQEQNNMSPAALGIIFAPTFFRPRDTINDLQTEVFEAAPQARIIELMIRFYIQIFEMETDLIDEPVTNLSSLSLHQQKESVTCTIKEPIATLSTSLSLSSSTMTHQNRNFEQQLDNSSLTSATKPISTSQPLSTSTIVNQTSFVLSPPLTSINPSISIKKDSSFKQQALENNNESTSNHHSQFQRNNQIIDRLSSPSISTSSSATTNTSSSESHTPQTRTRQCYNCSRTTTFTFD
nr:rho GTPase-activating protein 29-like isoform X1 [Dermatophagoides farinae]